MPLQADERRREEAVRRIKEEEDRREKELRRRRREADIDAPEARPPRHAFCALRTHSPRPPLFCSLFSAFLLCRPLYCYAYTYCVSLPSHARRSLHSAPQVIFILRELLEPDHGTGVELVGF